MEFGSFLGGSTIFFADILKIFQTGGKTLSVDIEDRWDPKTNRPDIQKLTASSISDICRTTVKKFREENPGNVLIILDSEHTEEHIYKELQLITPLLKKGDYLIVEDALDDPGMIVAMKKFFGENPLEYEYDKLREEKFGVTAALYGYWIKK
jgi:cephalosporin hydroxylase